MTASTTQYPSLSTAQVLTLNNVFTNRKQTWLDRSPVVLVTDSLPMGNTQELNRYFDSIAGCLQAGIKLVVFNPPAYSCTRIVLPVAKTLRTITQQLDCGLIVNHQVDIALAVEADGVNLGQQDMDPETTRRLMGRKAIIGLSVTNQEQALLAMAEDVDYVTAGPVFASDMLPGILPVGMPLLRWMHHHCNKPWIATGGIDESTLPMLRKIGVQHVAVSRCLMQAKHPTDAAKSLLSALGQGLTKPYNLLE
jgi:thiamine-phosphate pyrophosphorylase